MDQSSMDSPGLWFVASCTKRANEWEMGRDHWCCASCSESENIQHRQQGKASIEVTHGILLCKLHHLSLWVSHQGNTVRCISLRKIMMKFLCKHHLRILIIATWSFVTTWWECSSLCITYAIVSEKQLKTRAMEDNSYIEWVWRSSDEE